MAIIRSKADRYTVISQAIIKDKNLALKDLGLLVHLLSLPDNWGFSENGLIAMLDNDGQTAVRTALKHLEEVGYLKRERVRDNGGRVTGIEWFVYDKPYFENHSLDNSSLDSQPQYNTNQSSTKLIKPLKVLEVSKGEKPKSEKRQSFDAIIEAYTQNEELQQALKDFVQMRTCIKKPMTNRSLELMLKRLDTLAANNAGKIAVLNQSIMCSWQGIFPLREEERRTTTYDDGKEPNWYRE